MNRLPRRHRCRETPTEAFSLMNDPGVRLTRPLIFMLCAIAALALLMATIGAVLAMITGHIRWIELAWLSIAASLLAIVVGEIWPWDRKVGRSAAPLGQPLVGPLNLCKASKSSTDSLTAPPPVSDHQMLQ